MGTCTSKNDEYYIDMSAVLKKKMLKKGIILNTNNNKDIINYKNIQEITWNNEKRKIKIKYKKEIFVEFTCTILPFEKIILHDNISNKHVEILFSDINIRNSILANCGKNY